MTTVGVTIEVRMRFDDELSSQIERIVCNIPELREELSEGLKGLEKNEVFD